MNAAQRSIAIREQRALATLRGMRADIEKHCVSEAVPSEARTVLCRIYGLLRELDPPQVSPGGVEVA